jgi:tRNA (Thr-GGU) A37 N-methylase
MGASLSFVGRVRSGRSKTRDTPIQAALNADEEAFIEVDSWFQDGLDGLNGFDYLWVLTWLGQGGTDDVGPGLELQ